MVRWFLALVALVSGMAAAAQGAPEPGQRIPLWEKGAPGFEERAGTPEQSKDYWTKRINAPSVTYYPAHPERRTGASVIIMPGGAHQFLVITTEGDDVARWYAQRGVAAFVLRYRLFREEGSPYRFSHAREDAERAVRLVRSRAAEFDIAPDRIGVMGFSAGGELARVTLLSPPVPAPGAGDAIDRLSARPDYGILVFPGPLKGEEAITRDAPPLLLSAASDDACCSQPVMDLMTAYRAAGASAELHMYAAGGHAYNMGEATPLVSLRHWPDRITDWMTDRGLLSPPPQQKR
jgi:acetyl esterase/lipase